MIALLLLLLISGQGVRHQVVDRIELNQYIGQNGKPLYEQYILWDWSERHARYHVVDFWVSDNPYHVKKIGPSLFEIKWRGVGIVRAREYVLTETTTDPEVYNHKYLPPSKRRKLHAREEISEQT